MTLSEIMILIACSDVVWVKLTHTGPYKMIVIRVVNALSNGILLSSESYTCLMDLLSTRWLSVLYLLPHPWRLSRQYSCYDSQLKVYLL